MLNLLQDQTAFILLIVEWVLCFTGIVVHIAGKHMRWHKFCEVVIFMMMGWALLPMFDSMTSQFAQRGLALLIAGGLF